MTNHLIEVCAHCHLFVTDEGDDAGYQHLHRGNDADEILDATHAAEPSGQAATLEWWREHGPLAMRARFLDQDLWEALVHRQKLADNDGAGVLDRWEAADMALDASLRLLEALGVPIPA